MEENTACANKLICEVRSNRYGGELFLFKYSGETKNGHVWLYSFADRDLSKDDRYFLNKINNIVISDYDNRYNQIIEVIDRLNELNYNPLMSFAPSEIIELNTNLFDILRSFLK